MATKFTFINAALTRTGNEAITSLEDGVPGSNIATQNYDLIKHTALTSYPWKWATKTAVLSALAGTPEPPWLYAYQMPTDVLDLRVVTVGGYPIDYETQFDKLLCDFDTSTDVVAKYTWAVPETYWPSDFAEAITQVLEALFLRGIGERYDEAEARQRDAMRTMQAAKTADAKKASTRNPVTSPTLVARGATLAPSYRRA